ncbi:MAG: hypothetical protein KAR24_01070 [Candidatus Pacebacteria bacterium]|nr:hypothetical protein [Candidatus Paceibacterota bacterium]
MKKYSTQKGFVKYVVIFIVLVVLIAMFNIDVGAIIESDLVQSVYHYIKVILSFIYDAFVKVIGQLPTNGGDMATSTATST